MIIKKENGKIANEKLLEKIKKVEIKKFNNFINGGVSESIEKY